MASNRLLVEDERGLAGLVDALAKTSIAGLDTEFVRERTYYPRLCLIQVSTHETVACVDCLAELDLQPLFRLFTDPGRQWVLHSARQDLEVLQYAAGWLPARMVDTQIAAALLGYAPQIGLSDLLEDVLGVALEKGYTRTDWSRRPLPEAAIDYALDDVRFLLPLWDLLRPRLETLGRMSWLGEDCNRLLREPMQDTVTLWSRLKGLRVSTAAEQRAALALMEWRERTARQLDRPRRWILSDEALLALAKMGPADDEAMGRLPAIPRGFARRWGAAIREALARADTDPQIRAHVERIRAMEEPDKDLTRRIRQRVEARARELGIHTEVLATRKDIARLAVGGAPGGRGWRANELARLLTG